MSSKLIHESLVAAILVLVCCFCAPQAGAISSGSEIINTEYAVGKSAQCALRDHHGFLWIGTTSGLYAYDSRGYQLYPMNNATTQHLPDVKALFELDGQIWAGASNGLWIYDRASNSTYRFPVKTRYGVVISSPVQRIMMVGEGRVWILTFGQGLFIFNIKDNTLEQDSRSSAFYSDMTIGSNGNVYAVTLDGKLISFNSDGRFIESLPLPDFTGAHNSLRMTSDSTGILVGVEKTIYSYNPKTKELTKEQPQGLSSDLTFICTAPDGVLLGTRDGILIYDRGAHSASAFMSPPSSGSSDGLPDGHVTFILPETDGSILVLTKMGGISYIFPRRQPVELLPLGSGGTSAPATAICVADDGSGFWVGSPRGIYYFSIPGYNSEAINIPGTMGDDITAIAVSGDDLWVGTASRGVFRYNRTTGDTRHYVYNAKIPNSLISNSIRQIFVSTAGDIYVLADWGICRYIKSGDEFNTIPEIDSNTQPLTIGEDRNGSIWMPMADGTIFIRDKGSNSFGLFMSSALKGKAAGILRLDKIGNMLAAANDNRIYVLPIDGEDFAQYSPGIQSNYPIIFMEPDTDGKLWVGDASGSVTAITTDKRVEYYIYRANGKNETTATQGLSALLSDGKIIFGDCNGLLIFNPREMKASGSENKTFISAIDFPYIDNSLREQQRLGIGGDLCDRESIVLPFSDNTFTLFFTNTHAGNLPDVRFRYRLDGYDKEWQTASGPSVTYTRIPPGRYTLLLHTEAEPESAAKRLEIIISAPWYRTIWAYIIYFILAAALGWVIWIVVRGRVRLHYRKRLNEMRVQKERETFEAKMQFFVNLVHEIRTPLTLISLPLEQMAENVRSGKAKSEDNKKHIKSMRRNVNYLLGIVNQLLDFRKAQSGSEVQLNVRRTDMNAMISEISRRFDHPMEIAGKTFELILPDVTVMSDIDPDKMERVVMNIVSNAMKYSRSKVTVELCAPADGEFAIKVSDDGSGVPKEERKLIFDTYYQISGDNVAATLGTGLGLAYAKLIAKAHRGSISVNNNISGGATFTIVLNTAATAEAEQTANPELIAENDEEAGQEHQDTTVLLVDDNTELLTTVSEALAPTFTVLTAESGEEALEVLASGKDIDFIISDFMMPGMSGARLCQRVKTDIRFSHIPFIMLTAKTDREAKEEGMEAGVDVYVEKPFTIKQIKLQIANMLKARALYYQRMSSSESPQEPAEAAPYINPLDSGFLSTLNAKMSENISDEEFSIDSMAEQMNMSRSSFYRKLKAITGMTPVDYLKNCRLEHAARLIREGTRITEVALMSGFTSSSYFSKCFKAKYGQNPKEYQQSQESPANSFR